MPKGAKEPDPTEVRRLVHALVEEVSHGVNLAHVAADLAPLERELLKTIVLRGRRRRQERQNAGDPASFAS